MLINRPLTSIAVALWLCILAVMFGCTDQDNPYVPTGADDPADTNGNEPPDTVVPLVWEVEIEKCYDVLQGFYEEVEITADFLHHAIAGFDILIGYDTGPLIFAEALPGQFYNDCQWEYFTYRYNMQALCDGEHPSGLVRIVALADINNGPIYPDYECMENSGPSTLAVLKFYVSQDRQYECTAQPISFFWCDCGDNSISTRYGDTLAVNRLVFDHNDSLIYDFAGSLPGYGGIPDNPCLPDTFDNSETIRYIDFHNGMIDIVCADSIDSRGDINWNGVAHEIADAVMYISYFMNGLDAFGAHIEGSVAASDVNGDDDLLTAEDFVYLVRIIVGDAQPEPGPPPGQPATIAFRNGFLNLDSPVELGAALFIFNVEGDIADPVLNLPEMDLAFARHDNELRVMVYNIGDNSIPEGQSTLFFIDGNAQLTYTELATYDGFHTVPAVF